MSALSKYIRDVVDFPKKGIVFKDLTPLLKNPQSFSEVNRIFYEQYKQNKVDYVAAIESRGFIVGAALALQLNAGFIPIRKKGKLPYKTVSKTYDLEYGTDTIEMHVDAVKKNDRVLLVDDLIATGGTMRAAADMITQQGAELVDIAVIVELAFLEGRKVLKPYPLYSIIQY